MGVSPSARGVLVHHCTASPRNLADFPQHRGVRAETYEEYVQSTCEVRAKSAWGYGPFSLGGVYNRRTLPGGRPLSPGGQRITFVRTILPLYVPSSGINPNQSEPRRTIPFSFSFTNLRFEWKSELSIPENFNSNAHARIDPFFIRMKIHSGMYRTVFILIHKHVPNNFRFEWKSELNQTTEQFFIRMKIRALVVTQL